MSASVSVTNNDLKVATSVPSSIRGKTRSQIINRSKFYKFLDAYKVNRGNIGLALRESFLTRSQLNTLLEDNPEFRERYLEINDSITDEMRAKLIEKGLNQEELPAITFWLKHKDPEFKDDKSPEGGTINIQVNNYNL